MRGAPALEPALSIALACERGARALEACALGAAAALAALLAASLDAGWQPSAELFAAAALAGFAAALSWILEERRERPDAARALDRALGEDGLVLSALEGLLRPAQTPAARALASRARARLRDVRPWRVAEAPRAATLLPALLMAALALALLERVPTPPAPGTLRVREGADPLAAGAGEPRDAAGAEGVSRAELGEPSAAAAGDPAAREASERPENAGEGRARGLEEGGASAGLEIPQPEPSSAPGEGGGQTAPERLGTMLRSSAPEGSPPLEPAPERGLVLRRWTAADDELVRRWLDALEGLSRR